MKKDFFTNILILIATNFLVRPIYLFFVEARIQNQLGQEEYGTYFIMFTFSYLFIFINDPGLQNFTTKKISEVQSDKQNLFSMSFGLKLLLSTVFSLVCFCAAILYGYSERMVMLSVVISLGFVFSGLFVFLRGSLAGLGDYRKDSWISSLDRLFMIIILGSLVWSSYGKTVLSIEVLVTVQLICYITSCLVVLYLLSKRGLSVLPKFDFVRYREILQKSLPFALIILMTSLYTRIDGVMLGALLEDGEVQAGIYAAGYRFLDAGNMLGYLFGGLLLPMYSNAFSKKESLAPLFDFSFRTLFVICTLVAGVALFFGKEIFYLVYNEEIAKNYHILGALMLSLLPLGLAHSVGSLLQATNKLKELNILMGVGVLINVVANLFVIPSHGALGAAYATFATEMFIFIGMYTIVVAKLKVSLPSVSIIKALFILIGSGFIFYACAGYNNLHFVVRILISIVLYGALIFVVKIVDKKEFKDYV